MKALFYFVDGFAWNYVDGGAARFSSSGWAQTRPLETVLGYSSSIVPVLISGKLPAETGVWTEYYRKDTHPSVLGALARRVRFLSTPLNMSRLVAFRFARKAGMQGAHRLRIPLEFSHHFRRHPIDYTRMPPCNLPVPTIADTCARLGLRFSFHFIGSQGDAAVALESIRQGLDDVDVFFLYDSTVDHAGHRYGPDLPAVAPFLDRIGVTLDELKGIFGSRHALETLMFSDHGMTMVQRSYDIFAALHPLQIGRDYLAFPDSTFTRFWYPDEASRARVRDALCHAPGTFLTEAEAARYGVPYPDSRYGEDVLIAEEGVVFHPSYISPSFFRTAFPDKGMHGYRPECSSADGVVLYSGNVLKGDLPDRVPATSVYPAMSSILEAVST